jgi:hypothetical protein
MSLDEIGTFTPEQARMLWQDYQERRQLQPQLRENFPRRRQIDEVSPHRQFVLNESGEEIPAYGCMEITGTTVVAERTCLTVQKPSKLDGEYVFNSQFAIPASGENESGVGWGFRYGIVRMLGDAPTEPKQYKPIVGSWEVEEGDGPFVVFGEDNAADDALVGRIGKAATGGGRQLQGEILSVRTASGSGEDAPYTGLKIATVEVYVAPCSNPELIGETVDVVDHSMCVLDLDEEELVGLWMWANEGIAESRDPEAEEGELTPCHWVADDRCCAESEGGESIDYGNGGGGGGDDEEEEENNDPEDPESPGGPL